MRSFCPPSYYQLTVLTLSLAAGGGGGSGGENIVPVPSLILKALEVVQSGLQGYPHLPSTKPPSQMASSTRIS